MLHCFFGYLQQPFSGPTQIPYCPLCRLLYQKTLDYRKYIILSYAACFAVATAIKEKATVVTGDPGFGKVAGLVDIDWLGE